MASAPSASRKSRCIMPLASYRSRKSPIDSSDQAHLKEIIGLVDQSGLPGMYQTRDAVAAGGLISYGPDLSDLFLRGAGYVHRILQGAKPAELAIEQPVTFELTVNLKTANALGINVALSLLALANDVIE